MEVLSNDHSTHASTPTHTPSHSPFLYCSFVHFCLSLSAPPFAVLCSLVNQSTFAGNTMSLGNLSPLLHGALHIPIPLSFSVCPSLLSLFFSGCPVWLFCTDLPILTNSHAKLHPASDSIASLCVEAAPASIMIQCSLLTFVSPLLPCLYVSLLLQTWDEFADNTAPQFLVLVQMKLVVIHVALATAGVVGVRVSVFPESAHLQYPGNDHRLTAMHQLVCSEGQCVRVHKHKLTNVYSEICI